MNDTYTLDDFKIVKTVEGGNNEFITAIINEPRLLILDEPFSGLDPFNVELFKNEIIEMSKQGSKIIPR